MSSQAALLKKGTAAATTDIRRVRMQTAQLAVLYPLLLRWTEMRAFAAKHSVQWTAKAPLPYDVRFLPVSRHLLELSSGVWALECGVLTSREA